ncbi:hypothetical protein PPSIR1_19062 [Plesiocystis pacifica SIR-1]|uniref:Lipoprotein n=1 Tax=Plesiocystis pacifica SIR-1 TaxID=391625 RepID=A6GGM9_9BACT|nr:hypothetical protein PPSIR1_19062 [Plesiocystis pacifica SIR-1]
MRSRGLVLVFIAGLLLPVGCGAPDITGDVSDYAAAVNGSRTRQCDCHGLLGYASIGECKDGLGDVTQDGQACIESALAGEEERGAEFLPCATTAYMGYSDCLAANVNCDESALMLCTSALDTALDACSESDLRGSIEACL